MKYSTTSLAFNDRFYINTRFTESKYTYLTIRAIVLTTANINVHLDTLRKRIQAQRIKEIKTRGMIRVNLRANVSIYRAIKIAKSSARHNTLLTFNYDKPDWEPGRFNNMIGK